MKCECNCGLDARPRNRYIHGHNTARPKLVLSEQPTQRDEATGCLLFLGSINSVSGYGYLGHTPAHRVAYAEAYGPIPVGHSIDHVYARGCRHRNCIEPAHLQAVTPAENTRRASAVRVRSTHCKHGHLLAGENLRIRYRNHWVERVCRACHKRASHAHYLSRRHQDVVDAQ